MVWNEGRSTRATGGPSHFNVAQCYLVVAAAPTGAQALAGGLKDKPNLASVSFSKNGIGVEGRSGGKWRRAGMVVGKNGEWQAPLDQAQLVVSAVDEGGVELFEMICCCCLCQGPAH
jgi:hypothetical protein